MFQRYMKLLLVSFLPMCYNLVFDSENHKNANIAGILVVFLRSKMSTISSFWFVLKYFSSFFA